MVIKVKVSDVAKDFGKTNKEIIEILGEYCDGAAKKAGTVLEEEELNILFDKITMDNSVKTLDAYFNSSKKQAEKKEEKKQDKKETKPKKEKASTEKDKKRESQAAILQMADQAAKRAEEKAKKMASPE